MEDKLLIGICDDFTEDIRTVERMCKDHAEMFQIEICTVSFSSSNELLKYKELRNIDVLFLDIEMEDDLSGIEVMEYMQTQRFNTLIIFITSHFELSPEAYGKNVCGFLTKPLNREKFDYRLAAALSLLSSDDLIVYIESDGAYYRTHYANGKSEIATGSLKDAMSTLDPNIFIRCHKSYLINLSHVAKYTNHNAEILMDCGQSIPVSKRQKAAVSKAYSRYCIISFERHMGI